MANTASSGGTAAQAAPAVHAIFIHPRSNLGNLKDLVASRLVVQLHLRAARAHRIRLAVLQRIKLSLIDQRPAVAGVPGLSPALAPAGTALRSIGFAWAIGRWRLGRVVGVQLDPLLQPLHPHAQFGNDRVAFG